MTTIVLSYRREDSAAICGRIYDRLCEHFGHDSVFMDIDAIPLGVDFRDHIRATISRADALLVITGPRWLGRKKTGIRINEPSDWVRIELEAAFESKVAVFPVLVGGAAMPKAGQLPPSIREFAYLQAAEIDSGLDFHPHIDRLIRFIDQNVAKKRLPQMDTGTASAAGADPAPVLGVSRSLSAAADAIGSLLPLRWAAPRWATAIKRSFGYRNMGYWLSALVTLVLAFLATPYVEDYLNVVSARDFLYQEISRLEPRAIEPRYTKVVWIGDDEYWRPPLNGRTPINRKYLADIVRALDAANTAVIALDFKFFLPDPSATGDVGRFDEIPQPDRQDTADLIQAIVNAAARGRKIVLSKTIWYGDSGGYKLLPDIYQPYGICVRIGRNHSWFNPGVPPIHPPPSFEKVNWRSNITCGYIALPYDMRLLPPALPVLHGGYLDSFSLAIARAYDPERVAQLPDKTYYGSYIPEAALAAAHTTLTAHETLNPSAKSNVVNRVEHRAVIVGGHWSQSRMGQANFVDQWQTPLGLISGSVIHQNFVEAILDGRNFEVIPRWVLDALTLIYGLVAIFLFARAATVFFRLWVLMFLFLVLVAAQWLMMMIFGTFFDAFIVLFFLWLQAVLSRSLPGAPLFTARPSA